MSDEKKSVESLEKIDDDDHASLKAELEKKALSIIVFGASGHLAKTKTYPALYELFEENVYPSTLQIIGFARSEMKLEDFHKQISANLKGNNIKKFLSKCTYFQAGDYDDENSYKKFGEYLKESELKLHKSGESNRLCYLATPPGVFVSIAQHIAKYLNNKDNNKDNNKKNNKDNKDNKDNNNDNKDNNNDNNNDNDDDNNNNNWVRVIIEKPFGKDYKSNLQLSNSISKYLKENKIYRIDHYLAKEMVQNILVFRFSNIIWDLLWDRKSIRCVKISMKETDGVSGRGGYYDEYGVIRDVFQNHLMQVLCLLTMETPVSLKSEDIRNEKLKLLKAIENIKIDNIITGQYNDYCKDESILKINPNSKQITFIQSILFINNNRWFGVPFICKCGKALDSKNTEIRIQFKNDGLNCLFPNSQFNELVIRLQPSEAIWLKLNNKKPGFFRFDNCITSELNLTYKNRFNNIKLPEAYTRLILDCLKGDQSLFVREDELSEAWRVVDDIIHYVDQQKQQPPKYDRGSRGPPEADVMAQKFGFRRIEGYEWMNSSSSSSALK